MENLPVIRRVNPELNKQLLQEYNGERTGFVQIGPEEWLMPIKYEKIGHEFSNFEVRPDDTWLITFPRSGTTLFSELIWLLENDMDFDTAKKVPGPIRFPFLDMDVFVHDDIVKELRQENKAEGRNLPEIIEMPNWKTLKTAPSPRFIKSHLPIQLLPKNLLTCGAKVFYVARNPKDVIVSCFHMFRMTRFQGYVGDLEHFSTLFEKNLMIYTPYWDHVIGGWNKRANPNFQFLFYEEYVKNPSDTILKVADFLNKPLTQEQVTQLVDHLSFDNFKRNKQVNHDILAEIKAFNVTTEDQFVRKGKVCGWVAELSAEASAEADKWIEENLKKTDLRFPMC